MTVLKKRITKAVENGTTTFENIRTELTTAFPEGKMIIVQAQTMLNACNDCVTQCTEVHTNVEEVALSIHGHLESNQTYCKACSLSATLAQTHAEIGATMLDACNHCVNQCNDVHTNMEKVASSICSYLVDVQAMRIAPHVDVPQNVFPKTDSEISAFASNVPATDGQSLLDCPPECNTTRNT